MVVVEVLLLVAGEARATLEARVQLAMRVVVV